MALAGFRGSLPAPLLAQRVASNSPLQCLPRFFLHTELEANLKNQKELLTAKEMEVVFSRLEQQNPSPKPELLAPNPYCFLVSVVLSAQATDKSVNAATAPLYKKVKTPKQMLALGRDGLIGYIKSIEQLLWGIVFIIGEGRSIGRNNITINGDNSIRTTLEDFCYFINSYRNRNLCDDIFEQNHASSLMEALHDSIEDYKNNCRNGYLHKHNVEAQDVSMIRKKTFLLYFLLLGILKISDDDIIALGGTK